MPKKTATARGGAQRNKPKAQKSFELVRPVSTVSPDADEQTQDASTNAEPAPTSVSTVEAPLETKQKEARRTESKSSEKSEMTPTTNGAASTAPKGSAAARLATRRQAAHKSQQRAAATLITAEHYAYVRRDLVFIAILATIMFAAIIVLQFVPGI